MEIHEIYQNVHKDTDSGTDCQIISFHVSFLISVLASSVRLFSPASPGYAFFMASMNPSSVLLSARAFFIVVR